MSHTPGPWSFGDVQWIMHRESGLGYSYRPITSGACEIAQVWEDDDDSEMSANVRLISAAPELLAALKLLRDLDGDGQWRCDCNDPYFEGTVCENCVATAAINKAEGRSE